MVVGCRVDDQSLEACRGFLTELAGRLTTIPYYSSDELGHYMVILWEIYRTDPQLDWDTLPFPLRAGKVHPDLDYAVFHKERDHSHVVYSTQRVVFGNIDRIQVKLAGSASNKVNTAFIERFNGTLRQHDGHFRRRSQHFAKAVRFLKARLALVLAYYNLIRPHWTLSHDQFKHYRARTSAQAKGLIDETYSLFGLLCTPVITNNV